MADGYRYSLQAPPESSNDGSGTVRHDIRVYMLEDVQTPEGEDIWTEIGHKTFVVPSVHLFGVLQLPHGNEAQQRVKFARYQKLLEDNANESPIPNPLPSIVDWSPPGLEQFGPEYKDTRKSSNAANLGSDATAADADAYFADVGLEYPIQFLLSVP